MEMGGPIWSFSTTSNSDSDADNLPDDWETKHFGNLSQDGSSDADSDGLTNLSEYQINTDPNDNDTDDDGMSDNWETFNYDFSLHEMDYYSDTIILRFGFHSDSIDTNKEGWMIDDISICGYVSDKTENIKSENLNFIYPNPFYDNLIINLSNDATPNCNIQLYDIDGNLLYYELLIDSTESFIIDRLKQLYPGIYIIKLLLKDKIYIQKIIKL